MSNTDEFPLLVFNILRVYFVKLILPVTFDFIIITRYVLHALMVYLF